VDSEAIVAWAEQHVVPQSDTKPAKRKPGQRGKDVTGTEVADILRWHAQGLTQQQIADKFEPPRAQSAISDILSRFGPDRTVEAKAILRSGSADMALNILKNGKPKDQVVALKGLNVLDEQQQSGLTIEVISTAEGALGIKIATLSPRS
jgi:hypothetical protein